MKIFMTGGAGYIGSSTIFALLEAGHSVTVYDDLSRGHRAAIPTGASFVQGGIGDREALSRAMVSRSFDVVIHLAAFIEAGESMENPGMYFRNNVSYAHNVIEAAVDAGCHRFVLSSTAAVYASSDEPLTEESDLGPANTYGETKLMIETMLRWYQRTRGVRYAALRYFNACGALPGSGEAHHPETHLIPRVLQVALGQREQIDINGTDYPTRDGTCVRDYVHVADLADAHLVVAEALTERDVMIYNLGTGRGYSVLEVLETAREVTGHPIPSEDAPRREGDAVRLVACADRIQRELGWQPRHSTLNHIVDTAWEWHNSHPFGYDPD